MRWIASVSAGLALWFGWSSPALAQDLCAQAVAAAPGKACVANPNGVVLAPDAAEAEPIAAAVREGEARFARHFGRTPPRYAIVVDFRADELRALSAAGFLRILPWLTAAQFETNALESVRRGAEAQARAQGLGPDQAAAVVEQAEARWRTMNTPEAQEARDAGVLPHEIGHMWYAQLYWPESQLDRGSHYGGPGPDWLDETAAILMESDGFAANRRRQFELVYRGGGDQPALSGISTEELIDLRRFLTREHPGRSMQAPRPAAGQSGPQIRILTGEEGRAAARGAALFYLQGRMFADFLLERSGNPAVFADIGAAFGAGRTIDQWLAARGEANHLPASIDALDAAWRTWLRERFGSPGNPAA